MRPDMWKRMTSSGITRIATQVVMVATAMCLCLCAFGGSDRPPESCPTVDRPADISPDYAGVTIPPNIAPLRFCVNEDAATFFVRIAGEKGESIEIATSEPEILIPEKPWRRLLDANHGGPIRIDIFAKSLDRTDGWKRFDTIVNTVAADQIDGYIAYRRIRPGHSLWRKIGIYQRDLQGYGEDVILDNSYYRNGCVNCHTFCNNRTEKMLIGIRSRHYGSHEIFVDDGRVTKIGTKFGYTSWHPSGKVAAYSINKVNQFWHSAADEIRDVLDFDSLIAYYRFDREAARTAPMLSEKGWMETYPTWSPDGKYLYFCRAPIKWDRQDRVPKTFDEIKYDLVRVSYDVDTDTWGQMEPVLSSKDTGQSILLPRISPDGRWLLVTMCDYGCFPVYRSSSDLYMIDLKAAEATGQYAYRRLDINSDASESWHSFSSNGRWIAFSSKRLSHIFTRTFLAYLDDDGRTHKPFVLPQKDPRFYDSCLWTFSVPELTVDAVRARKESIGKVVRGSDAVGVQMPITMATPKAGAVTHTEPWRQGSLERE